MTKEFEQVKKDAIQLSDLLQETLKYVTQKDLAEAIERPSSVLSKLKKVILPSLVKGHVTDFDALRQLMSDTTVMRRTYYEEFSTMIAELQAFNTLHEFKGKSRSANKSIYHKWRETVTAKVESSAESVEGRGYTGLYDIYTFSSFGESTDAKKLTRQPMMLRKNNLTASIEVFIGNAENILDYYYEGIAYTLGSHILYISAIDFYGNPNEVVNIQLTTPHLRNPPFLRGIILAIDTLQQPFATRVVAVKKGEVVSKEKYDKIPTEFIPVNQPSSEMEASVIEYLKDEIQATLKCSRFLNPTYDFKVLQEEKQDILERFKDFKGFW